jgi:hypothetical protein
VIKPPSLVREYTWIWSGDPALDFPETPKDAKKPSKEWKDWERRLKQARELGVYDGVLKAGQVPTKFNLRVIPNDLWMALVGLVKSGSISDVEWPLWAARMAIHSISDTGIAEEADIIRRTDPNFDRLGQMAPVDALNQFGPLGIEIANDMFLTILERQQSPSPK